MTDTSEFPPILQNWAARNLGSPKLSIHEYPLYSDAEMIPQGVPRDAADCPYYFFKMSPMAKPGHVQASVILRIDVHYVEKCPGYPRTNDSFYHGGLLEDEIAALASLCFGVRIRAGGKSRHFNVNADEDPLGRPVAGDHRPIPTLDINENRLVLPDVAKNIDSLDEEGLARFEWLLRLSSGQAIALIRAARLYQDALWIVESEPALAWLMLVSALETAANQWRANKGTAEERLTDSQRGPELVKILKEAGGDGLITKVAEIIAPSLGVKKKFVDFVMHYLPRPPESRPRNEFQISWDDKDSMKEILKTIYDYRSQALHVGTPFPAPMCDPPSALPGGYAEKGGVGLGTVGCGGEWLTKDLPINLHAFHYIARKVLLRWWGAMANGEQFILRE